MNKDKVLPDLSFKILKVAGEVCLFAESFPAVSKHFKFSMSC